MVRKTKKTNKTKQALHRIWEIICWPFRKIWSGLVWLWNWIAGINLVALLNLALLVSIIVLFSLLIIDLRKSANATNTQVITLKPAPATESAPIAKPNVQPRKVTTLPMKRDPITRKAIGAPVNVAKLKQNPVAIKQVATIKQKTVLGDTIIDHHDMTSILQNGAHIRGNLYIQDLRKYTLPCDIIIDGNLILRDVNMLNFCGDFTVRGNIYVNPRSSFGPVPSTARVGGQVIL